MATSITLRQLEYFVAIARYGSMARAASLLHVSAAAVSLGVSQLERTLECDLFLRRPHQPLLLTSAGRDLLVRAVTIVADAEEMERMATHRTGSLAGTVYVGCFDTLAPFLVPQLLAVAGEQYPELVIDVTEGQSDLLQDALMDGTTDFAILYGLDVRPVLRTEVVWTMHPYVVLSADHPLADETSIRLAQLGDEPMVLLDSPPSRNHVLAALDAAGVTPTQTRVTHNFETLRSLVARGFGWGVLVQHPEVDASYEGLPLRRVQIADPVQPAPVVVATIAAATLSRRTLACIEMIRSLHLAV
ncbi:MAG: LysR substrate-binding domain-containing protein [Acidimicrobiales bacterium]|nr:LysR substrate-binding domain-containing protein [Acidimicrobiales bacterium]